MKEGQMKMIKETPNKVQLMDLQERICAIIGEKQYHMEILRYLSAQQLYDLLTCIISVYQLDSYYDMHLKGEVEND